MSNKKNVEAAELTAASFIKVIQDLGQTVRAVRQSKGITLEQLKEKSGLSRQWLNNFETGKLDNVSFQSIAHVTGVLDIKISIITSY